MPSRFYTEDLRQPEFNDRDDSAHEYFTQRETRQARAKREWIIVDANGDRYCGSTWTSEKEANEDMKAFAQHDVEAVLPLKVVPKDEFVSRKAAA